MLEVEGSFGMTEFDQNILARYPGKVISLHGDHLEIQRYVLTGELSR